MSTSKMDHWYFLILILLLDNLAFMLHTTGLFYLYKCYHDCRNKQQRLLVASLSLSEAIFSFLFASQDIIILTKGNHCEVCTSDDETFQVHLTLSWGASDVYFGWGEGVNFLIFVGKSFIGSSFRIKIIHRSIFPGIIQSTRGYLARCTSKDMT